LASALFPYASILRGAAVATVIVEEDGTVTAPAVTLSQLATLDRRTHTLAYENTVLSAVPKWRFSRSAVGYAQACDSSGSG